MKSLLWKLTVMLTAGAVCICTCGCTLDAKQVKATDLMENVKAEEVSVSRSAGEESQVMSEFAIRLFQACDAGGNKEENTLVSPLSVLFALSMAANGAQGETLNQMEDVLGGTTANLNEFARAYLNELSGRPEDVGTLELANSIWFKDASDFRVNQDFLQLNADYYNADIYSAAFDNSTLQDINRWVKNKTQGMIPTILDDIPEDAVMYLINALAFDAEWE
ncbi:MAG: serine protease, partial [Acetatifactor sp.]|nr:serine protease [Acetatifactor sp.]